MVAAVKTGRAGHAESACRHGDVDLLGCPQVTADQAGIRSRPAAAAAAESDAGIATESLASCRGPLLSDVSAGSLATRNDGDRGSVTVEAAIGLAVIVVVIAAVLAGIGLLVVQLRCFDAAGAAARLAARGDDQAAAEVVRALVPSGHLDLRVDGDLVWAEVTAAPSELLGTTVSARAVAALEVGVSAP